MRLKMIQRELLGGATAQHKIGQEIRLIMYIAKATDGQMVFSHLRRCLTSLIYRDYRPRFAQLMTLAQTRITSNNVN